MLRLVAIVPVVFLAACASPYEQCVSRATKDLRVVDRLIKEKTATLERGYAIAQETYTKREFERCYDSNGDKRLCRVENEHTRNVAVAVNLEEEQQILNQLVDQRAKLDRDARNAVGSCRASHPEG